MWIISSRTIPTAYRMSNTNSVWTCKINDLWLRERIICVYIQYKRDEPTQTGGHV